MTDSKDKSRKINVDGEEATPKAAENKPETEAAASEENTDAKTEETPEADPLEEAQKQIEELKEVADKLGLKIEKTELILNGGAKTVAAILPVLDDFERAIADKSDDPKAIKEGIQNIFNKFVKSLESLGVKQIETKDKDFDTDYHEAVAMVPGMGDDKKGKVVDCLQTGYTMNDKVIRHAKVAVGQ